MLDVQNVSPYRGMRLLGFIEDFSDGPCIKELLKRDPDLAAVHFCWDSSECRSALDDLLPDILVTTEMPEDIVDEAARESWRPAVVQLVTPSMSEESAPRTGVVISSGMVDFERCLNVAKAGVLESKLQDLAELSTKYLRSGPYRSFASSLTAFSSASVREEIPASEIFTVTAAGNYLSIDSSRGQFRMRDTLENLEQRLNPDVFTRVHRSILVNRSHVRGFFSRERSHFIHLANGEIIAVGPKYRRNAEMLRGA